MAGAYCKYCGTRCFVLRVIPDGPEKGRSFHLATCQGGMAHDLKVTGHTHLTAINPVTAVPGTTPVISDTCLYGDCDCDMPGCACECHDREGCDHDHSAISPVGG